MKNFLAAVTLLILSLGSAQAAPITFAFADDPSDFPWIGRSHTPGVVTGILYGLSDTGNDQLPTSILFTSDVSALGITQSLVASFTAVGGAGFDLLGGTVVDADLLLNFNDPVIGGMQIRFDWAGWNVLHWNGGSGPLLAMGNNNGFAGTTYGSVTAVPAPGAALLLLTGFAALVRRRHTARR